MAKKSMKGEILAGTDFVQAGKGGGTLLEIGSDCEILVDVPVPMGRHRARDFMHALGKGHFLIPGSDVICYPPDTAPPGHTFGEMAYETAASQTFRVDRSEREKRRNDRLERQLNAQGRRQALLERALLRSRGEDPGNAPAPAPSEPPVVPEADAPES